MDSSAQEIIVWCSETATEDQQESWEIVRDVLSFSKSKGLRIIEVETLDEFLTLEEALKKDSWKQKKRDNIPASIKDIFTVWRKFS